MILRTENPKAAGLYPIRSENNTKFIDTAIAFSELLQVIPQNKDGNRTADNYIRAQCDTGHCNYVELSYENPIALALAKLLESIKSDLVKAHKNGYAEGCDILKRLNNGTLSTEDYERKKEKA